MRLYFNVFLFCFLSLMARQSVAAATCQYTSGGNWSTSGNLIYQRDQSIGSGSGKYGTGVGTGYVIDCTGDATVDRNMILSLKASTAPVPGFNDVYPTNIDGVGVRFNFGSGKDFCPVEFDAHIVNSSLTYTCPLKKGTKKRLDFGSSLEFIKLKDNVASGALTTIPKVTVEYSFPGQSGTVVYPTAMWKGSANVNLTVISCTISSSSINVPFGDILATSFTGVGVTSAAKNFNLNMDCNANANINLTLSGTANTDITNNDIIALTNAGAPGVASGIGAQVLYNGTPIKRDTLLPLKKSTGGIEAFPFSVRYYQTKSTVTTGVANAVATLNITYQ